METLRQYLISNRRYLEQQSQASSLRFKVSLIRINISIAVSHGIDWPPGTPAVLALVSKAKERIHDRGHRPTKLNLQERLIACFVGPGYNKIVKVPINDQRATAVHRCRPEAATVHFIGIQLLTLAHKSCAKVNHVNRVLSSYSIRFYRKGARSALSLASS